MATIKELKKRIIPFPPAMMEAMDLADEEKSNFINYKLVPVALLVKAVWNYKGEDQMKSEALKKNIQRHGQIENLHTRELKNGFYEVVNGNHRLDQLIKLKKEFALVYHHGQISATEAKRIALETNELRFETNEIKLAGILKELTLEYELEDLSVTLPYSEMEIQTHVATLEYDYADFAAQFELEVRDHIKRPVDPKTTRNKPTTFLLSPKQMKDLETIIKDEGKINGKKVVVGIKIKIRTSLDELNMINSLLGKSEMTELNEYSAQDLINKMMKI